MRIDAPSRPGMLGDSKAAVRLGFDNRVPDIRHVRNGLPVNLAITARRLRAAFHDVAGDRAAGQLVELVRLPTKPLDHGSEGQRRIGGPARDNHIRARGQRFGQWESAMLTLGLVLIALPLGVIIGLAIGIWGYRQPRANRWLIWN